MIEKASPYILFFLFSLSQSTESAYSTGLPQISQEMNISANIAQISSSIYFYGFATGILILGRISDIYGRRPIVLFGLSLFLITCIVSFYVKNIELLIFLRFLQAFGASVGSVTAQAIARDTYFGADLSKLYATLSIGIGVAPAVSSLIGGNIVAHFGWRYIFIYLFLTFLLVFLFCVFKLKETNRFISNRKSTSYSKLLKQMASDKKVVCFGAIIGCFNGIMYSFYIEAPFIFIQKLSVNPSEYGWLIFCLAISGAIGAVVIRYLQSFHFKNRLLLFTGITLSLLSCTSFLITGILWYKNLLSEDQIRILLITSMMSQSFSYSFVMPMVLRFSLEDYGHINGTAGSIFGCYYYTIVATLNFLTSMLHAENILRIAIFYCTISMSALILFAIGSNKKMDTHTPNAV